MGVDTHLPGAACAILRRCLDAEKTKCPESSGCVSQNLSSRCASAHCRKVLLAHAVELLGISPLLERMPDRFSDGEKQRIANARVPAASLRINVRAQIKRERVPT